MELEELPSQVSNMKVQPSAYFRGLVDFIRQKHALHIVY